jgi:hypothetical protein
MVHRGKYEKLLKNSNGQYRYQFNWVSGGFNDIWAKNLKEFKVELKRRFGNSNLDVDYKTLHKATESGARSWDRAGNMLCW